MRTEACNRSHHSGSKFKKNIVLTVEEANAIVDCDPDVIQKIEVLLKHSGFRKKNTDDGRRAG